ncbi:DUF1289 domain-containing protein [Pseudooceanicola algae]|uniref:Fe-S protein n=1 Tax=Pseudooceanicola algae TaxID=1537215 RepID=A0A418SC70_9RHOB|nr:DUF1289 domain-containing protein [Pseudooceanicola algae]QPM89997.1 hypothetical protein PSAL_012280 [Pseudooceanicola algae]
MTTGKEIWHREEIASPCVNICVMHPQAGLCTGCLRSRDEIAQWSTLSQDERRAIMAELPERGPLKTSRRGGRAGRLQRERDGSGS